MTDTIIIIGAGIAGLAAGCYAQMNGYHSRIYERHDLPGGLCTAWNREGYTFDGCIHYLFGTAPDQPFHHIWRELGAVEGRTFIHHKELLRIVDRDGTTLIVHSDPDELENHLHTLSPEDYGLIEELAEGIRHFTHFDMTMLQEKPRTLLSPTDWLALGQNVLPFALPLARWGTLSAREFGEQFRSPFLRRAIPQMFAWEDIPMMAGLSLLAYMHLGNAGFPAGGSLEFARAIERRYLELGGEIHYNAQVEQILIQENKAVGVRLYDNREEYGDVVISAADGYTTLFNMLDDHRVPRDVKERFDGHLPVRPQVQVSLGIARDFSREPHWTIYLLDEPIMLGGQSQSAIGVKHYSFDFSLAPAGKSVIEVMFPADYDYWQNIHNRKGYRSEEKELLATVIAFLETKYPGITADIEVTDVATPTTYERYTGNWQGSTCGWLLTDKTMMLMIEGMDKTLPDLHNFYMAGQWVEPGGSVPIVAMSGRNAIQLVCHADHRPFVTAEAFSAYAEPV
jgi:phytoene dehydrogenase-like protein